MRRRETQVVVQFDELHHYRNPRSLDFAGSPENGRFYLARDDKSLFRILEILTYFAVYSIPN